MITVPTLLALAVVSAISLVLWKEVVKGRRAAYIRSCRLPPGLVGKLAKHHVGLSPKDCDLVEKGLRQFFLAYLMGGRGFVSMPSQVADDLWHEFILYTRFYDTFCKKAFGRFLHHTPAVVLRPDQRNSNAGLRRVWYWACKDESIDPKSPSRLPLLFALDAKLKIAGGYRYAADCGGFRDQGGSATYCGGDFGSSGVDGGTDGFGDGDSSGDGGDGGGGCGGD